MTTRSALPITAHCPNSFSDAARAERCSNRRRSSSLMSGEGGADARHRLLAAVIVDDRERRIRPVGHPQVDGLLKLGELGGDLGLEVRDRAPLHRVGRGRARQPLERRTELAARRDVGIQVGQPSGQQEAALARFRVGHQGLDAVELPVDFQGLLHLAGRVVATDRQEGRG